MIIETNHARVYEVIFAGNLFDDRPSLITDVKLENHGFESKLLRKGVPLIRMWPADFTISVKGSKPVDYLLCKGSYPIVSTKVKEIVDSYQMTGIEFLPVNILPEGTENSFAPYWVWNVYNIADCLDSETQFGPLQTQGKTPFHTWELLNLP